MEIANVVQLYEISLDKTLTSVLNKIIEQRQVNKKEMSRAFRKI